MRRHLCLHFASRGCSRHWRLLVPPPCHSERKINALISLRCMSAPSSVPVWQQLVEGIQMAVEKIDDMEPWWQFCRLWRVHFPQESLSSSPEYLLRMLETELLAGDKEDEANEKKIEERVPHDLHSLPVFLQALSAAVQLGETRLRLFSSSPSDHKNDENDDKNPKEKELLAAVVAELRVCAFYLAQERLTHTLHAVHYRLGELAQSQSEKNSEKKSIVPHSSMSPHFRDGERVSHMGVRLTDEEMKQAMLLADTSAALLAIDPPAVLFPSLYRLLLPALGACEQLEIHQLGALATAVARSADFNYSTDNKSDNFATTTTTTTNNNNNNNNNTASADTERGTGSCGGSADLIPGMTSYTVLSHLHAIARALEIRMREAMRKMDTGENKKHQSTVREAQLRLLSLKKRKELEKQIKMEPESIVGDGVGVDMGLLENVSVVCTALAARRYSDDRFWKTVTEYILLSLHTSSSSSCSSSSDSSVLGNILQPVRDILFALDHVHQETHFNSVMLALVKLHFLEEPIPPPSALRNAMKAVKSKNHSAVLDDR